MMDSQLQANLESWFFRVIIEVTAWHKVGVDPEWALQRAGSWASEVAERAKGGEASTDHNRIIGTSERPGRR